MDLFREETEYFTNQLYKEIKRTTMINYDQARENFVNMGEMMIRLIYQVACLWC